ncbi:MAG: type II secretion system protein N [Gammaproteobacteria bacterium]
MIQDYLFKILADQWTRLFVTLVMLAMLAYQLSIAFWQFYAVPNSAASDYRSHVITSVSSTRPEQSYLEKAQIISRAYLFGKPEVVSVTAVEVAEAPETKLNYKLRGIYYSTVGRLASAIVEIKTNDSQYYRLDDELAENIIVAAIERDHILINRYGKIERLNLEKPVLSSSQQSGNSRSNATSSANSSALLRSYKKRYASNPMSLATRFQAIPVRQNGQNIGFRLKALRGESLLKKLNFQDSDVFTQVNGIGLDKPFQALDALRSLTTSSEVSVTILRNGIEETMNFDL